MTSEAIHPASPPPTVRDPDSALEALRDVAARSTQIDRADPVLADFLRWLAAANRAGTLPTGAERERFISASAPLIEQSWQALDRYVYATSRLFLGEWYDDEWVRACETRSRIQYLADLYRGSAAEPTIADGADPVDLDTGIRGRGDQEGNLPVAQIPPGTPSTHWWWWYPNTPPG